MRVIVADDSALFREGLRRVLGDLHVDVIGAVADGPTLLDRLASELPDVVILDIRMPPGFADEGLVVAAHIRDSHPDVGILLLSTYAEGASAARLLHGGSRGKGYLLKDRVDDPRTLLDALHRIAAGGTVLDPDLVTALMESRRHNVAFGKLSERERAVLSLMAQGQSNAGISRTLFLSTKTVETHISTIFAKLDLPPETAQNRRVTAVLTWLHMKTARM